MSANLIAENMSMQIDKKGNRYVLMDKITDHCFFEAAVKIQDAFVTISSSTKRRSLTTQGVSLYIKWYNVNTIWVPLKDVKEYHLFQLAEYAVADKISIDPAFAWWVPHTLKKRNRIIAKLKCKYWLKTQKFRIKASNNIK